MYDSKNVALGWIIGVSLFCSICTLPLIYPSFGFLILAGICTYFMG